MSHVVDRILATGRLVEYAHREAGTIPLAAFRIFLEEIEQLNRDSATELSLMGDRVSLDERNDHGFPTRLGMRY